jgi:Rieske Fe-S protein
MNENHTPVPTADTRTTTSRRTLLVGSAVGLGALGALTACGGSSGGSAGGTDGAGGTVDLSAVPVGGTVVQEVGGQPVVLAQPQAGTVKAFSGRCTHQGCAVAVNGTTLVCPCHGSVFNAATGDVEQGPATSPLPSLHVTVSGDTVTIG